ncbi:DUF4407 domain-containing protein [Micromonospora sp. NPDC047644]|uniref:DUF4407 domain-containing protein n=1 Tax=Micromonospora sp. NPDC047644 TaxID=3157203 RepID=UPI0034563F1E
MPTERPRYTAMGGVVVGTALMAMFSMTVALYCVFDGFQPSILAFVPVWGAFILFLDRWLMSSVAAPRVGARFRKLLPRLLLAIVFGVIIAEPLLLGVFHTAIETRVNDDRNEDALEYESTLKRCNPVPGTKEYDGPEAKRPDCDQYRFGLTSASEAQQRQVSDLQTQIESLRTDTDADDKEYARLESLARQECNGTDGPETTGIIGQGPNCRRLRAQADQYRRDQRMDANHKKLTDLTNEVTVLTGNVAAARADTADKINARIEQATAKFRADQKQIGLLERLGALRKLVHDNPDVRASEWGLRLFFIAVDALPVLLKFLNGFSSYDRIVADWLAGQRRAQRVVSETERRRLVIQEELARHQMNAEHASAVGKVEFDARIRNVDVDLLREQATDSRAAYLLHDAPTMPLPAPSRAEPEDVDPDGGRYR